MKIYFGSLPEAMEIGYGVAPLKVSEEAIKKLNKTGKSTKEVPTELRDEARSYVLNFLETRSNRKIWWDVNDAGNVTLAVFEAIQQNKDIPQKTPSEKASIACIIWRNKCVDSFRKWRRRKKAMEKHSAQATQDVGINAWEFRQWFEDLHKQATGTLRAALDDIADKYWHGYTDEEIAANRGLSQNTIRARRSEVGYAYLREKASEEKLIFSDFFDRYF